MLGSPAYLIQLELPATIYTINRETELRAEERCGELVDEVELEAKAMQGLSIGDGTKIIADLVCRSVSPVVIAVTGGVVRTEVNGHTEGVAFFQDDIAKESIWLTAFNGEDQFGLSALSELLNLGQDTIIIRGTHPESSLLGEAQIVADISDQAALRLNEISKNKVVVYSHMGTTDDGINGLEDYTNCAECTLNGCRTVNVTVLGQNVGR